MLAAGKDLTGTAGAWSGRKTEGMTNIPLITLDRPGTRLQWPFVRILTFFCLIGIVAVILDLFFTCGLRRIQTSEFGSFNRVMSGQANADIVINGSSRAVAHYDPRIIHRITGQTAYNLGRNASQTDMQLAVLKAYLDHNMKPKIVVQNLDLFSFVVTRKGEVYDPGFYLPYLYDNNIYHALLRIDPNTWKWKYIPLYGYAIEDMRFTWLTGLKGLLGIYPKEDCFLGFNPRDVKWSGDFERFKAKNPQGVKFATEKAGAEAMEALIRSCQDRGIQVILVYSPEYFEMQALETDRARIIDRFREISERFNVPFWDYSDSPICQRQEYFQNSQHLNADGGEVFSSDLARRLVDSFPLGHSRVNRTEHDPG
jgi:hypothetical protein